MGFHLQLTLNLKFKCLLCPLFKAELILMYYISLLSGDAVLFSAAYLQVSKMIHEQKLDMGVDGPTSD